MNPPWDYPDTCPDPDAEDRPADEREHVDREEQRCR